MQLEHLRVHPGPVSRQVTGPSFLLPKALPMWFGRSLILASPVSGRMIAADGAPLTGVPVLRRWSWVVGGENGSQEVVTDSNGEFRFAAVQRRRWGAALLPHAPEVRQEIVAFPSTGEILLMRLKKLDYAMNGERDGKPLRLSCRTDTVPVAQGAFWGICTCED